MDYLPHFLKYYDFDLKPTNAVSVDVASAKSVLYPGAHIATSNPYEHYHHGIVTDINTPDISIIHLWGAEKDTSRVQTTDLTTFLAGSPEDVGKRTRRLYLVNYDDDTLEKQQQSLQVAKELLTKADDIVYDIATLNCESFAYFCRTGKWHCEQVNRLRDLLIEKTPEIFEKVKNANEHNKKQIASILKTVPADALNPSEKEWLDRLSQQCNA